MTKVVFLTSLIDCKIAEEFSRLVNKSRLFVSQSCLGQVLLSRGISIGLFALLLTMAHGTGCTCKSEEPSEGEQSDHEPGGIRSQVIGERS